MKRVPSAATPWAVINEQSSEIDSCHASREAARRRRKALTSSTPTPRPFHERRGFQGAAAVVALVGAVLTIIGAPKLWDVVGDLFSPPELPYSNTEIVLDASIAMSEPSTRWSSRPPRTS